MSPTASIVVVSLVASMACWLIVTGWREPRPSLERTIRRIRAVPRDGSPTGDDERLLVERIGAGLERWRWIDERTVSSTTLRLVGRTPERHLGLLVTASFAGLIAPSVIVAVLVAVGLSPFGLVVPVGLSLVGAVIAPVVVHLSTVAEAEQVTTDLRHQLSAYLDMVTMLLAGNTGHEGALEQAAQAGDGLLFRELRRRMREVATTGDSLVVALGLVADDFGLVELEQVAAATALSAAEGAPVARTLAAKCSTLRSTLASDQEATARVRNDKVTPPLVGMALLFMALIIYPALDLA